MTKTDLMGPRFRTVTSPYLRIVETRADYFSAQETREPVYFIPPCGSAQLLPFYEEVDGELPINHIIGLVVDWGSNYQRAIRQAPTSKRKAVEAAEWRDELETISRFSPHPVIKDLCAHWLSDKGVHELVI